MNQVTFARWGVRILLVALLGAYGATEPPSSGRAGLFFLQDTDDADHREISQEATTWLYRGVRHSLCASGRSHA